MWNSLSLASFNSATSQSLYESYQAEIENEVKSASTVPRSKNISPSSLRCKRKIWFKLRGSQPSAPPSVDHTLQFFARIGTACHKMIQERLQTIYGDNWLDVESYLGTVYDKSEFTCADNGYETLVTMTNLPIRFSVDGLVRIDNTLAIIEIKSIEYNSFQNLHDIKDSHIDQAVCYATLLKVNSVIFIYIDRTYGEIKCFELQVNAAKQQEMMSNIHNILDAVEKNIAPPKLPTGDIWCNPNRCEYYKVCKEY